MKLDQDYFFWGCGESVQYGLYSSVVDRFVSVGTDVALFEHVVFLMSSKIKLLIVPLHCAPNFTSNLIDNTCCTQWSVINWPANSLDSKFNVPVRQENFVVDTCGDLAERKRKSLTAIQNFIFLSCYVIRLFKFSTNYQYRIFSNLVQLPFDTFDQVKQLELQCYRDIYLSDNYMLTKTQVTDWCQAAENML